MYIKRSKIQVKSLIYPILKKVLESLIYYYLCAGNQTMIQKDEQEASEQLKKMVYPGFLGQYDRACSLVQRFCLNPFILFLGGLLFIVFFLHLHLGLSCTQV